MRKNVSELTKRRAKELRKSLTPAEKKLWSYLRNKQLLMLHVRKQHPIEPYIADFCIEKVKLIIEVDGYTHDFRMEKDKQRDEYLSSLGYKVIRIQSQEVMKNIEGVVEYIKSICEQRLTTPSQSPPNLVEKKSKQQAQA